MYTMSAQKLRFTGVLVPRPPRSRSFQGEPQTLEQFYELSEDDIRELWPRLSNLPIRYNHHDRAVLGHVVRPFRAENGDVCVELELNDSLAARALAPHIVKGVFRGLSLKHNRHSLEPLEVSICDKGARDGSWLTEQSVLRGDKVHTSRLPVQRGTVVQASFHELQRELARDPGSGRFRTMTDALANAAAAAAPAAAAPAPPATPTASGAGQVANAASLPAGTTASDDIVEQLVQSGKLTKSEATALLKQMGDTFTALNSTKKELQAAQGELEQKRASELEYLSMFNTAITDLLKLSGIGDAADKIEQALKATKDNNLRTYATAMSAPIVAASAALKQQLAAAAHDRETGKRKQTEDAEKDDVFKFYQMYKSARSGATEVGGASAAAIPQHVAASAAAAPALAPPPAARGPPPSGLAPEVEQLLSRHRSERNLTFDVAGVLKRAEAAPERSAFF